jgi:hypothetical protein
VQTDSKQRTASSGGQWVPQCLQPAAVSARMQVNRPAARTAAPRDTTHLLCMVVGEATLLDCHRHQLAVLKGQAQPHPPHTSC